MLMRNRPACPRFATPLRFAAAGCVAALALGIAAAQKPPQSPDSASASVTIKDMAYAPRQLTVAAGTKVTWSNQDDRDHSVRAADGSFSSGNLSPKSTYSHTFKTPGTYDHGCALHPRMRGTIIVK